MDCKFKISKLASETMSIEHITSCIDKRIFEWAKKHGCYDVHFEQLCISNSNEYIILIEDAVLTSEEMREIFCDGRVGKIMELEFIISGRITPVLTED